MKQLILTTAALLVAAGAAAQSVRGEWDVHFRGAIVNDEFDVSKGELAQSGTLAAINFAPYAGIGFGDGHHLKAGFNIQKDFGTPGVKPETEFAAWYQYEKNGFTLAAGIFPYALGGGSYSSLLYSDAADFYDIHCDGFLLRWQKERSNYELFFDWCGKFGETRREEFYVVSTGEGWVKPWMALCWEGIFHHYACSEAVDGVVDDHLIHPFVQFEFSSMLPLQRLEFSVGAVAGYQKDRKADILKTPLGVDAVFEIRKWNFGVRNQFYYGASQMPFYESQDASGKMYGSSLYFRAPWWRIRRDGNNGIYDGLDVYWQKSLNDYVDLGIHARFHFDYKGFLGSQQLFTCSVNLDRISFKKK